MWYFHIFVRPLYWNNGTRHSKVFLLIGVPKKYKKYRKIPERKFKFMFVLQRFYENWKLFLFFSWIKIRRFRRKLNVSDQIKPRFSFWLKINLRKMACNKHVDLRRIENLVRSKGKTANFRKICKNFKIVDEILIYKGKRWVIFDNDRNILNHNTTLFYR